MSPRHRQRRLILAVAVDLALFTAALFAFAYFHHVRRQDMTPIPLSPGPAATAAPVQTPSASLSPAPSAPQTGEPTAEPTPTVDPNDLLRGQYAERFTSGEVISTESGYQSSDVSITIDRIETETATYYVADIYIKYLDSFRAGLALEHSKKWMSTLDIAEANHAILAISGDFYGFRKTGIVAVRNGAEWIKKLPLENDLLVMYYDGSMETVAAADADVDAIYAAGPYQIWCFGPELLRDGRAVTEFTSRVAGRNPRSAIGYFEPGHYCFVLVDGRQRGYSLGMTLAELSATFEELGCAYAYNLDGGDTAVMVYDGKLASHPEDHPRELSDILYIGEPGAYLKGADE